MTTDIQPTTPEAEELINFKQLVQNKIDQRRAQIALDIADIDDGITAAEMVPIIRRMLVSEDKLLKVLPKIVERTSR